MEKPTNASGDSAWVAIPTPLPADTLAKLCRDVEAVLRVNPYYTFHRWDQVAPGHYVVDLENHSNQTRAQLELRISDGPGTGLTIDYSGGIKRRTLLTIEPDGDGSRLTITDDYELLPEAERAERQGEVDKSLTAWGVSLQLYFQRLRKWSRIPGWRWYIRRVWVPMKPSSRRIVWLLYLITAAEFFFFLFVVLIWWIEHH